MVKHKFYYLPDFYNIKSDGLIGGYRDEGTNNVSVSEIMQYASNGDIIIITPASKRQLAKADAELLAIIKEESNKKEG